MNLLAWRLGGLLMVTWLLVNYPLRGQVHQSTRYGLQKSILPFPAKSLTDSSELTAFDPLITGKTIVAIGEVTHGTRQTAELQSKLARQLCQSHRFTTIVLAEIYASATLALNRYVLLDEGTLAEALAPLSEAQPIAQSLVNLIQWVHRQNRLRPMSERIWMVGTEVDPPGQLAQLLQTEAWETLSATDDSLIACLRYLPNHLLKTAYSRQDQAALRATFNRCLGALGPVPTDSLALLKGWNHFLLTHHQLAWAIHAQDEEAPRDSAMFSSVQWLLEQRPGTRIVIINAHNAHIEKQACYQLGFSGVKRLGHYLHQTYGASYCALGTEIDGGQFLSGPARRGDTVASVRMPRSRKGMGRLLASILPDCYGLLDLRSPEITPLFEAHRPRLSYGTSNQGVGLLAPSRQIPRAFDGLVFLGRSHPARFINIAPPNRFGVYVTLAPVEVDSLLTKRQLRIACEQIDWLGQPNQASDLRLQVYQHDSRKRLLNFFAQELTSHTSRSLCVHLRPHAHYVSISVVGRNGKACRVGDIRVNGRPVNPSSLQLVGGASTSGVSFQRQRSGFTWRRESVHGQP